MNECIVAFLMLSLLGSGQTFLTRRSEKEVGIDLSKNYLSSESSIPSSIPMEITNSQIVCLEVSPDLPPCNFDKIDYSIENEDSSEYIIGREKREVEIQNSIIVYKLEVCLPSRLPFRLPMCKPDESGSLTADVRKLYPFRTSDGPETAPFIFPISDHSQQLRLMKSLGYHPESSTEDKRNLVYELEDIRKERARTNRDSESIKSMKRKSKIPKKFNSNKIFHNKKDKILEFRSMIKEDVKKTLDKAKKRIEEDVQEVRGLGQKLNQLVAEMEFPYSRAIPYDPEKLQVAREGSEFPYSKAIPFDSKKLQDARKRTFPYWIESPYKSEIFQDSSDEFSYPNEISYENNFSYPERNRHSRKLQSLKNDQAVSFDFSMLEAAKKDGIFPYSKEAPRDTSRNNEKNSDLLKKKILEREKKTRIPLREIDNHHTLIKTHRPRRLADNSENLESWINHRSRTLKTIKEGSEFPYSKAIPYDPKKLRPTSLRGETNSKQYHHQSRKLRVIQENNEFPYTKTIPFNPVKLVVSKRKNELTKPEFETDLKNSKEFLSRKPLAINAGNNLSFALSIPYNRRASKHHLKDQRGKSS